jgi:mannose-6-phosphate isomerase
VADTRPADFEMRPSQLSNERRLLVADPHFVFERIDLAANSSWCLEAERETWLLVLSGSAVAGSFEVAQGDALFAQLDRVEIDAGASGMVGLVAYTGRSPVSHLLQRLTRVGPIDVGRPRGLPMPIPLIEAKHAPTNVPRNGRLGTIK